MGRLKVFISICCLVLVLSCSTHADTGRPTTIKTSLQTQQRQEEAEAGSKQASRVAVQCTKGDKKRFGDPQNDNKYYMCTYSSAHRIWMVYPFNCGADMVFDERSQTCAKKSSVNGKVPQNKLASTRYPVRNRPNLKTQTARPPLRNLPRTTPRVPGNRNRFRPQGQINPFRLTPRTTPSTRTARPTTTSTAPPTTTTEEVTTTTVTTATTSSTTTTTPAPTTATTPEASDEDVELYTLPDETSAVTPTKHMGVLRKVASNIAYLAEVMDGLLTSVETFISNCDEFVRDEDLDEILPNLLPPASSILHKVMSGSRPSSTRPSATPEDKPFESSAQDDLGTMAASNEVNNGKVPGNSVSSQSGGATTPETISAPDEPSEWNVFLSTITTAPVPPESTSSKIPMVTTKVTPGDSVMKSGMNKFPASTPAKDSPTESNRPGDKPGLASAGSQMMGKLSADSMMFPQLTKGGGGNRRPRIIPLDYQIL